jgi:hypothetical protein
VYDEVGDEQVLLELALAWGSNIRVSLIESAINSPTLPSVTVHGQYCLPARSHHAQRPVAANGIGCHFECMRAATGFNNLAATSGQCCPLCSCGCR